MFNVFFDCKSDIIKASLLNAEMKIVKAKKKVEVPRSPISKTYTRIPKPKPITTLNVQNERWNYFNQKAAELASCHKANIIILAHFQDCENEPSGMSYVSAFGDVAKEYQSNSVLQTLADKFARKCSQPDHSAESCQEDETDSSAKEDQQPVLVTVVRNFSEVIDQVATDSEQKPNSFANQIGKGEEIEDLVVSMTENDTSKNSIKSRVSDSLLIKDDNPRVLTLGNFSPLKTYSVSPKSGKTNNCVLETVQLRPKPLGKPVFVSNGHTYASLEDGSVVKVLPVQFARQDSHNKEIQVEEASVIEVGSSESSTPLPPGCVEIIMSTEINEAIEAMNNDVLAPSSTTEGSDSSTVVIVDHHRQPLFNDDDTRAERKRGRPKRGSPYPSSSVPRSSRNDKSNYRFKCDFCTRSFRDSFDLKVHVRTHTGERPFRCDECDQSFSLKCTLKVHQLLHTGERPFQCELCDKAFTRNDYLTRHLTSHTGTKPFTCPTCNKSFALKGRLNKHQRSLKHFDDNDVPFERANPEK